MKRRKGSVPRQEVAGRPWQAVPHFLMRRSFQLLSESCKEALCNRPVSSAWWALQLLAIGVYRFGSPEINDLALVAVLDELVEVRPL
ncbi:hypothetical protein D3C76_1444550 [compost metagenome]